MSLEIYKCKITSCEDANEIYQIEYFPCFKKIKNEGVLYVDEVRIGKDCLNSNWHDKWEFELEIASEKYCDMIIVLPDQVESKVLTYLEEGDDLWFDKDAINDEYDFLYISW